MTNQTCEAGEDVGTMRLPRASGGDGSLRYVLTPALPAGMRFDSDACVITGTPRAAFPRTRFTYTATDANDDSVSLRFYITVTGRPAGVTVSALSPSPVEEGGSATYTVVLDSQPTSDVVIEVSSDNDDVTVSPPTLTFTSANWSTGQTVMVSAAQDDDAVDDTATITHAVDNHNSANCHTDADASANCHTDADASANCHTDADASANCHTDADASADANCHTDAGCRANLDTWSDHHVKPDSDCHAHSGGYGGFARADANCHTDAGCRANLDTWSDHHVKPDSDCHAHSGGYGGFARADAHVNTLTARTGGRRRHTCLGGYRRGARPRGHRRRCSCRAT